MVESQRHEQVKAQLEKTKLELESLNRQVTINKQEWQKRQTQLLNQNESLMVMIIVEILYSCNHGLLQGALLL